MGSGQTADLKGEVWATLLAAKEIVEQYRKAHFKVLGDFTEDAVQCADSQFFVGRGAPSL